MNETGDIPPREDVRPDVDIDVGPKAELMVQLVQSILESGGVAHVYLPHLSDGQDRHLYRFNTHVYPDCGIIYTHGEDEDHWIPASAITEVERHYET